MGKKALLPCTAGPAFPSAWVGAAILLGVGAAGWASEPGLLFHAEAGPARRVLSSGGGDTPFNPASVLKIATSHLALETFGPQHRWTTDFACRGRCDVTDGTLSGDLVIFGGNDPDFHTKNAWLVARELKNFGITEVAGNLVLESAFVQGWEQGAVKRESDPTRRALMMGERFVRSVDHDRWDRTHFSMWEEVVSSDGWTPDAKPNLTIKGRVRVGLDGGGLIHPLLRHFSNPLAVTLKRFNLFSNNDIIRIADPIGGARAVEDLLERLVGYLPGEITVGAASGEKVNRLTPRQVVRLIWAFDTLCGQLDLTPADLLPTPGCDGGPVMLMFPELNQNENACTTTVKTGTLTTTDGGVAVLAGIFRTAVGEKVAFCVAAPEAGNRLTEMRRREQEWLLTLMASAGGARQLPCGAPLRSSHWAAGVVSTSPEDPRNSAAVQ